MERCHSACRHAHRLTSMGYPLSLPLTLLGMGQAVGATSLPSTHPPYTGSAGGSP